MAVQSFPRGMRISTLEEREDFYQSDFDIRSLEAWIGERRPHMKFALIPGRHTGIFPARHQKDRDNVIIVDTWKSARDVRAYAIEYLPEGLYYDRNRYEDVAKCRSCSKGRESCPGCHNYAGQQLAFDLDPENVDCPYHGHIGDKIQRGAGLSFCMYEFKRVRAHAMTLNTELRQSFDQVQVVYSGRGFHVVVDDERAYALTRAERTRIAKRFGKRYPIDEWVTSGGSRLMRLPYSLNGLVSRKCMIIKEVRDLVRFDPRTSKLVLPRFIRSA